MAIAFDAHTNGSFGVSPLQWNHTCTGSNRMLFVAAAGVTGDTVTGVTYNSVAMTQVGKRLLTNAGTEVYLYVLHNPTSGANQIAITTSSGNAIGAAASYTGANQSSTMDSSATGYAAPFSTTLALTTTVVAANCWLVGMWIGSNAAPIAHAGTTLRESNANFLAIGDSNATVGTGSQSLQVDSPGFDEYGGVIASFAPSGAGGATAWGGLLSSSLNRLVQA